MKRRERNVVVEAVVVGARGALLVLWLCLRAALWALLLGAGLVLGSLLRLLRWAAGKLDDDHAAGELHALGVIGLGVGLDVSVIYGEVQLLPLRR
ncbi:hypothetical protein [Pseudomonas fluorescens]|uniref:hypothetical protein n=1 Tax=Pseudomonas fluorescens TaxID=294 RepID=UPI00223ADF93|nr:hypothetical protein [Pseudomonas fluorescens]